MAWLEHAITAAGMKSVRVVVPTPMKHTMAIGRVVEIRYYPKDQIPKDMTWAQEILGPAKATE